MEWRNLSEGKNIVILQNKFVVITEIKWKSN